MAKQSYYCSVCGISSEVKRVHKCKDYGDYLCIKHAGQYKKYGKFLDNLSRVVFDPNEVRVLDEYAEVDTYDSRGNLVTTFKIDLDDVDKLSDYKWRAVFKNTKPYMFTGNQKSERIYFHKLIFPTDKQIDHISGDTSDNRKQNLREVTIQENMLNLQKKCSNAFGIRGVSFDKKTQKWKCDFSYKKKRLYIKDWPTKEQATYARYIYETTFLKEYRNTSNDKTYMKYINKLSDLQKHEVEDYVNNKINKFNEE